MSYSEDILGVAGAYIIPNKNQLLVEELEEVEEKMKDATTTLYNLHQLEDDLTEDSPISERFGTLLDEEIATVNRKSNELTTRFLALRREVRA